MRFKVTTTDSSAYNFYCLQSTHDVEEQINRLGPTNIINTSYDWPRKTYDFRGWADTVNSIWWPHGGDDFASAILLIDDARADLVEASVAYQVANTASSVSPRPHLIVSAMMSPKEAARVSEKYLPAGLDPSDTSSSEIELIAWKMYPLPPVLLTEVFDSSAFSGLWLLPLVDLRYFWRSTALLPLTGGSTTSQSGTDWPLLTIDHTETPDWMPSLLGYPDDSAAPGDYVAIENNGTHPSIEGHANRGHAADKQGDMEGWRIVCRDVRSGYNAPVGQTQHATFTGILSDYPDMGDYADSSISHATGATINSPGSGYTVGDIITVSGGTGTSATFTVTAVGANGAVTAISLLTQGSYSSPPSNPASTSSSGSGTGLSLVVSYAKSSYHEDAIRLAGQTANRIAGGKCDAQARKDLIPNKLAIFFKAEGSTYYQITIQQTIQDPTVVDDLSEDTSGLGTGERLYIPKAFLGVPTTSSPSETHHYTAISATVPAITATVAVGGSEYTVGDVLTLGGSHTGTPATFTVATLGASNAVATVTMTTPGAYTVRPTNAVATTGGTGSGCTLNVTYSVGSGYSNGDVVAVTGGTGTAANFTVTVSGGVVTTVAVTVAGDYTVKPTNPVSTSFVSGSGTNPNTSLKLTVVYTNDLSDREKLVKAAKQWAILYWRWRRKTLYYKFPRIAPLIPNGYAHMIRWDFAANKFETLYIALDGIQGTDDEFGGASSSADRFWAIITDKTYTDGEYTAYSWTRVTDSDDPTPLTWNEEEQSGSPGDFPAYEVNNIDLPVSTVNGGSSESGTPDAPLIVELILGEGDYYLINMVPRWEFVQVTGDFDDDGRAPAQLIRYDQDTKDWVDVEECLAIDANST